MTGFGPNHNDDHLLTSEYTWRWRAWLRPQQSWEGPFKSYPGSLAHWSTLWSHQNASGQIPMTPRQMVTDTWIIGPGMAMPEPRPIRGTEGNNRKPWPFRTIRRKDTCHQESLLAKGNLNWIKLQGLTTSRRKYRAQRKQPVRSRRGMLEEPISHPGRMGKHSGNHWTKVASRTSHLAQTLMPTNLP